MSQLIGGARDQLWQAVENGWWLAQVAYRRCTQHATPQIQVQHPQLVYWDGGSTPARAQVDLSVDPAGFDGQATLTWNTGLAQVYDALAGGNQLVSGAAVHPRHWNGNVPLYVEPLGVGKVTLTFSLAATGTYYVNAPGTVSGDVDVVPLEIEIKAQDGSDPVPWVLAQNKRTYKAVLTPAIGGGQFVWTADDPAALADIRSAGDTATVKAAGDGAGVMKLRVRFTDGGRSVDTKLKVTIVQLRIKDDDKHGDAKKHALLGEVDAPRRFAAVFEPAGPGTKFHWKSAGAQRCGLDHLTVRTDVATIDPRDTGLAKIQVTAMLDLEPRDQMATVHHDFTIVDVAIKGGDGRAAPPVSVLRYMRHTCKAVPKPAVALEGYAWTAGGPLVVVGAGGEASVELAGTAKTTKEAPASLTLAATLDGQTTTRQIQMAVTDIWVDPEMTHAAVDTERGTTASLTVRGAPDGSRFTWETESNGATIVHPDDQKKVTIRATQHGEVDVEITCAHENAIQPLTATGKIVFVGVAIKHEDGAAAAKDFVLAGSKRKYKAVPTLDVKGGTFEWNCVTPESKLTLHSSKETATITAGREAADVETIEVAFKLGGRTARARHDVTVVNLVIKDGDGESPANVHVLTGQQRAFRAVLTQPLEDGEYAWAKSGGPSLYEFDADRADAIVRAAAQRDGRATISVKYSVDGQEIPATHTFNVVALDIKDADGQAQPRTSTLKHFKQQYKAVPRSATAQGTFVWTGVDGISLVGGQQTDVVEIAGTQKTGEGETALLSVAYTLDGQTMTRQVGIAFTDISAPPVVVALDPEDGGTAEIETVDTLGEPGHAWDFSSNPIEASFDGGSKQKKIKVKAKKPGVVELGLTYTHALAIGALTAKGVAVFVRERIKSFTAEIDAETAVAEDAGADEKKAKVLLGLDSDPDVWKVGWVVAEAEGEPARLDVAGLPAGEGEHTWKPKGGGYMKIADVQPDGDHGEKKSKVLLKARPKAGDAGPPADPGHEDDEVVAKYTLASKGAKDKLAVEVHRHGCSAIKWHRKGKDNVEESDRIAICEHKATPQWDGEDRWTAPPGGDGIGILSSGGHQHGGRCPVCSGASSESASTSPRHVWHHVPGSARALAKARALADAVRRFARDTDDKDADYVGFLTDALLDYVRPLKRGSTTKRVNKGKMLGVLVGKDGTGGDVWLYALSGDWTADGGWSGPIGLGGNIKKQRTVSNFDGTTTTYVKTQAPFNTEAMTDGWGKLGRCAAQVLLRNAIGRGLKDIELAEVWLDVKKDLGTSGFQHQHEIGSCEQCRRCLGRLLCEVGA
ncbi:hypothetical protein WMF39_25235 [Sorangium sp. So ce1504]|uniref:hypothetical protein n=1 Tax=Sorangium sp. So ce1504 TaxID=3133337 RepID=UPI003F5D700A